MTTIERGMIIDVNLNPTKGSETGKIRPCIVVTNDTYNKRVPVIQVVTDYRMEREKSADFNKCRNRADKRKQLNKTFDCRLPANSSD